MIQFIIRITGSLLLLAGAIYIHSNYPETKFYNFIVIALLAFFAGEGPIYAFEKSTDRIEDDSYNNNSTRQGFLICGIVVHAAAVLGGGIFLLLGALSLVNK
jgi:hypothetical protein